MEVTVDRRADADVKQEGLTAVPLNRLSDGLVQSITVLVCRVWDSANSFGKYLNPDFLVSDKEGNVMHCVAWSNVAHCFVSTLEEGNAYNISNFTLRPNKEKYRICKDSDHIIQLEGNTVVRPLIDMGVSRFERYPFRFAPIEEIVFVDHKYLNDVIGSVSGVGSAKTSRSGSAYADCYLMNERWDVKMYDHEDGPLVPEKILVAVN